MTNESLPQSQRPFQGRRIHPALHFDEDFGCLGIVDYEGALWIVTSDRQVLSNDLEGMLFEAPPLAYRGIANRWEVNDLNNWLATGECPSFGETVQWIKEVILHFCELEYEEQATLIASWIMGTYFHQVFPAFPRLHLHGERGSGKSKILTLIAALAFNGLLRLNPTPATLFRLIHSLRPTLCLDEIETLAGHDGVDLLSILNGGYKHGAQVDRCLGENHDLRAFDVYSPVGLGGISGLNSVTEDRAITIVTVRGKDRNRLNCEVICDDPLFQDIRNRCYRLALSRFPDIRQSRQTLELPDWLSGRHRELYAPLLSIAALADSEAGVGLENDLLALAHHELPQRSGQSFEAEAVLGLLKDEGAKADPCQVRPAQIAFLLEDKLGYRVSAEKAGQMLKRLGFERNRDGKGTFYLVTSTRLNELEGGTEQLSHCNCKR